MSDCLFILLLLNTKIPIEALNVGDTKLILAILHWVVLDDDLLVLCANGLLVEVLLEVWRRILIVHITTSTFILLIGGLFVSCCR